MFLKIQELEAEIAELRNKVESQNFLIEKLISESLGNTESDSDDDIENMVKDAEANAEADKARRESAEARNNAESLIHATEKTIAENEDKIELADKDAAEIAISDLQTALEGEDLDDINAKAQALSQAAMKIGEAVYKAQQEAEAAGDAASDSQTDGEDVVEADFEEVSNDDSDEEQKVS